MTVKSILIFCSSTLLLQSANSACIEGKISAPYSFAGTGCGCKGMAAPGLVYDDFVVAPVFSYEGITPALAYERARYSCGCRVASTGGGLPCASASPVPPVGVSVLSKNAYEGTLAAGGNLPFLGTVGIEGVLPTAGVGAVSYGCGNSLCAVGVEKGGIATGIVSQSPGPYRLYGAYISNPVTDSYNGFNGIGYGFGPYGSGFGCGVIV